jgi:hypothetical protein
MARLMNDLTLDRLLECNLTAQAAFVVLGDLEAALRGTPDTALPPQASQGREAPPWGCGTGGVLLQGVLRENRDIQSSLNPDNKYNHCCWRAAGLAPHQQSGAAARPPLCSAQAPVPGHLFSVECS